MRFFLIMFLLVSCGADEDHQHPPQTPPPSNGGGGSGGGGETSYRAVQAIMNQKCLPCHGTAKFMESEARLRDSSVLARVRGRSMPPSSSSIKLGEGERSKILSFF